VEKVTGSNPARGTQYERKGIKVHAVDFEEFIGNYDVPGGLEFVAATYEQLGARMDSDASPQNEELFHYSEAAYSEAFWAYERIKNKL
jgi:hypothetical protein